MLALWEKGALMMPQRMIDRVAEAIENEVSGGPVSSVDFREVARVAIRAMREPTQEMLNAGWMRDRAGPIGWREMIDSALANGEPTRNNDG